MATMKTILLATITTFASASPIGLQARQTSSSPPTNTNSTTITYLPTLSLWNSGTSTVTFDASYSIIQRTPNSIDDISTLFTFNITSQYSSKTCEVVFILTQPSSNVSGTDDARVLTTSQRAESSAISDFRGSEIATLQAVPCGMGSFAATDGQGDVSVYQIACADLIAQPNYEIAPQGDAVTIYFQEGDGLQVRLLNAWERH